MNLKRKTMIKKNEKQELISLRKNILKLDQEILSLFKKRQETAKKIGALKKAMNIPVEDTAREKTVLQIGISTAESLGLSKWECKKLLQTLIKLSKKKQERQL